MKSFYTYNTKENQMLLTVFTVLIIFSAIGTAGFAIASILLPKSMLINAPLFGICLAMLLTILPTRKRYMRRIKDETIVAHDWGIEHQIGNEKREVKWDQIQGVDVVDRSFILWKMNQYVVSVAADRPIDFYSNLENADFLLNYIRKNLKKRSDDLDVKWVK